MESLDQNILFSDLFNQNLNFIEGKIAPSDEEEDVDDIKVDQSENNNNQNNQESGQDEEEECVDNQENSQTVIEKGKDDFKDISLELNNKQLKCFKPINEMKTTNMRFIAIQICTYFYHDLYKFFFHAFTLLSLFPIHQYLSDITVFIQQVGHYTHKEYFENLKIAFSLFYKFNIHYAYLSFYFLNSQFVSYCLSKDEIIEILDTIYEGFNFQIVFHKILFYRPIQSNIFEAKISRLEKEIKRLKIKMKDLSNTKNEVQYEKNPLSFINDEIIKDVIQNSNKKPQSRKYTDKFKIFCTIAYMFGAKCYNFIRKRIPLCSVSYLKKLSSPIVNDIMKSLFQIDQIFKIIENFKLNGLRGSLAVDAASFQKISGKDLLKKLDLLQPLNLNIDENATYTNVFVFLLQPFSQAQRTIPVQVIINQNGNANISIIETIINIIQFLSMFNISIDFVCTDGDHFYDLEHRLFFNDYIRRVYEFENFDFIYSQYVLKKVLLPNSDILHILKNVRSNLLNKDFIFIDFYNSITISVDEFEQYDLNKIIKDTSSQGSMKDSYPLLLFSFEIFKIMCQRKNYAHAFFILPYFFLTEAIRNPILSNDSRIYFLEVSFWFILYFFHQHNLVKNNYVQTKTSLIRTLNTILTVMISIQKHVSLKLSRVGTHCLECFFGLVRMACHGNHSFINILRSIAKSIFIKNKLIELGEEVTINGRENSAGTTTKQNSNIGVLPDCSPNDFFCLFLRLAKGFILENDVALLNNFIEMKSKENDTYSKNFMKTYIQGPFSGSNIRSRYINNRYDKNEGEGQIEYPEEEEEGDNDEVNGSEKVERPPPKKAEEEDICPIKLMQGEKPDVIGFYSLINPDSISLKLVSKKKKQRKYFFNFNPDD